MTTKREKGRENDTMYNIIQFDLFVIIIYTSTITREDDNVSNLYTIEQLNQRNKQNEK